MKRSTLATVITLILFPLLTHCDVSSHTPGKLAVIPESAKIVTFSGITWSDVVFSHTEHSNRYNGQCIKCHDHQAIAGETHWYCRSCHTAGQDAEKLCNPDQYHGCIMAQCSNCHDTKGANPGMTCTGCHKSGAKNQNTAPTDNGGGSGTNNPPPSDTNNPPSNGGTGGDDTNPTPFTQTSTGTIASSSEVDKIPLKIPAVGSLIIDVTAWEGCGSKTTIPTELFGDGPSNNKLKANIYLFNKYGTLVASKVGNYPGEGAPGAHITRTGQSPYLTTPIVQGTYTLAIGSYPLSEADARSGTNTDGSSWTSYDDYRQVDLYNKYSIRIRYQPQ